MTRAAALLLAAAACSPPAPAPPAPADALASELRAIAGADAATRRAAVARWRLDPAAFARVVTPTYRPLFAAAAAAYPESALVAALARPAARVAVRRHYAGDPRLTPTQTRLRWALPVLAETYVAMLDGAPLDAVFVAVGGHWRALAGLDLAALDRVAALDAACARALAPLPAAGRCTEVGFAITDAALRTDPAAVARGCRIAADVCGKPSP